MWAALIAELLAHYGGTQQEFARAIGVSRATISHWLSGAPQYAHPGVEVCLRVAAVTRTSASRVLRAGGKPEVALLLERLYGGPALARTTDPTISLADRRLLAQLRALDRRSRRALLTVLDHLAPPQTE